MSITTLLTQAADLMRQEVIRRTSSVYVPGCSLDGVKVQTPPLRTDKVFLGLDLTPIGRHLAAAPVHQGHLDRALWLTARIGHSGNAVNLTAEARREIALACPTRSLRAAPQYGVALEALHLLYIAGCAPDADVVIDRGFVKVRIGSSDYKFGRGVIQGPDWYRRMGKPPKFGINRALAMPACYSRKRRCRPRTGAVYRHVLDHLYDEVEALDLIFGAAVLTEQEDILAKALDVDYSVTEIEAPASFKAFGKAMDAISEMHVFEYERAAVHLREVLPEHEVRLILAPKMLEGCIYKSEQFHVHRARIVRAETERIKSITGVRVDPNITKAHELSRTIR